jgi:selenocysteine-specific elongation factor
VRAEDHHESIPVHPRQGGSESAAESAAEFGTNSAAQHYYTMGIAGHIDHGKTTLTKALTGVETDRLKEEQERHISIEVGFASFPLSTGENVGVVDLPGHARFIRQMVAGVAGIDLVLLVIAADEGVMPQTKEHLDILHLLGVTRGLIVLTKTDRVDEEFLELVRDQVREETEGTFLEDRPIVETDSLSGRGIPELKARIEHELQHVTARPVHGLARLPVDRVFSQKGFGTVVTGTLWQGTVQVGDEMEVLPAGNKVRVRQLQVHGSKREKAYAGQRVAANLSGIDTVDVHRGQVLATPGSIAKTERIDVELHMLEDLDFFLKQRSDIRLHLGTSEVLGRIIFFDRNECLPGDTCFCQLELKEPIVTLFADRFVLRRPTPMTTIGGGTVIDPYASKHRFGQQTLQMLQAKKEGDIFSRALHLLKQEGVQTVQDVVHQLGLSMTEWRHELETIHASQTGKTEQTEETEKTRLIRDIRCIGNPAEPQAILAANSEWQQAWVAIQEELEQYHQRYPLREGMDRKKIQSKHFPTLNATQWNTVLLAAAVEGFIGIYNETIALPSIRTALGAREKDMWQHICQQMQQAGIETPPWEKLLPSKTNTAAEVSVDLQRWLVRRGKIVPLDEGRFLDHASFQKAVLTLQEQTDKTFSIQEARDVFNTSRKYLIPFLEAVDREGYTLREDGARRWKSPSKN